MMRNPLFVCLALSLLATSARADLGESARLAISPDAEAAAAAIAELREAGPAGLEALLLEHHGVLKSANTPNRDADTWNRLSEALNTVGGQYDCHASRLYWYTDLERAKQVARAEGKPILSLRMLGKLTEECSCANSRFFRSTLYANAEVSEVLRNQFVLHWQSVRPVPKVTIDFGDGRQIETTLTGNSIHYILDAEGQPVDAIPGLYGAKAFLRELEQGRIVTEALASYEGDRQLALQQIHGQQLQELNRQWANDMVRAGLLSADAPNPNSARVEGKPGEADPSAVEAAPRAVGKAVMELPLLAALGSDITPGTNASGEELSNEDWAKIAALYAEDATIDDSSLALIVKHYPTALVAANVAEGKRRVENPLLRMVAAFQQSIARDTVRNEYLYHRQIHEWFVNNEPVVANVDELNRRVYAELFLTPDTDPWLGLVSPEVYTGLENGGIVTGGGGQ